MLSKVKTKIEDDDNAELETTRSKKREKRNPPIFSKKNFRIFPFYVCFISFKEKIKKKELLKVIKTIS